MYKDLVSGRKIGSDNAIVFANSALVNTQVSVDIAIDKTTLPGARPRFTLEVYNPSTVTDLTVKLMSKALALGGAARDCLIETIIIPKSQAITGTTVNTYLNLLEGLFIGDDLKLIVSNNTALGAAEGFTAYARVREV
jgi:hypothetical protein